MALPKRKLRRIVVDGVAFHWTRGRSPENMWVTVQHAAGQGSLLRIDTVGIPQPADIAEAVRFALGEGWQPQRQCGPFFLGFTNTPGRPRFVIREQGSPDYWREF